MTNPDPSPAPFHALQHKDKTMNRIELNDKNRATLRAMLDVMAETNTPMAEIARHRSVFQAAEAASLIRWEGSPAAEQWYWEISAERLIILGGAHPIALSEAHRILDDLEIGVIEHGHGQATDEERDRSIAEGLDPTRHPGIQVAAGPGPRVELTG